VDGREKGRDYERRSWSKGERGRERERERGRQRDHVDIYIPAHWCFKY